MCTNQLYEIQEYPECDALITVDIIRILLTQNFKMLEQAFLSDANFSAAWEHTWLPQL